MAPEATTPVPLPVTTASVYISIERLDALGLDPATAGKLLADAATVRTIIQGQTMNTHDDLVSVLVSSWGADTATRLNDALQLLAQMGLVFQVSGS